MTPRALLTAFWIWLLTVAVAEGHDTGTPHAHPAPDSAGASAWFDRLDDPWTLGLLAVVVVGGAVGVRVLLRILDRTLAK